MVLRAYSPIPVEIQKSIKTKTTTSLKPKLLLNKHNPFQETNSGRA